MNQTPEKVFMDGALSISLWRNLNGDKSFYTTQMQKVYTDDNGETQNTYSINGKDLLKVANLATQAYGYITYMSKDETPK